MLVRWVVVVMVVRWVVVVVVGLLTWYVMLGWGLVNHFFRTSFLIKLRASSSLTFVRIMLVGFSF